MRLDGCSPSIGRRRRNSGQTFSQGASLIRSDVAVIGGGLAGLYASRLLHMAGVDFVLLEARGRLGGRILTVDQTGQPSEVGYDLGPSWYWPAMQPALGKLVDELGLPAFEQHSKGDVIFERISRERSQRYRGVFQGPQSMRLVDGTTALVRALARELPPRRIQFNTNVIAMAANESAVELTIVNGDGSRNQLAAGYVIAALPPRLLEATISFTPSLDETTALRWRKTPTWMAPHAKFFALYDRPFWRDVGLSGTAQSMVGPMVEMHDATTAYGDAALFGFLGVPIEQRTALGKDALASMCLEQFERIFGAEARSARATLLKDWAADPLTATAEDRGADGHLEPNHAPWVSGVWQDRLTLAGSETSPIEPGYLAGAVEAATLAVADTLRRLRGTGSDDAGSITIA
ncbi:MAG: FAD-dependent oxidoreductase [Proteobacteria bacterium]|nr:FAD-dependent oxidoreductase [Pseudomonadota bacterium]